METVCGLCGQSDCEPCEVCGECLYEGCGCIHCFNCDTKFLDNTTFILGKCPYCNHQLEDLAVKYYNNKTRKFLRVDGFVDIYRNGIADKRGSFPIL